MNTLFLGNIDWFNNSIRRRHHKCRRFTCKPSTSSYFNEVSPLVLDFNMIKYITFSRSGCRYRDYVSSSSRCGGIDQITARNRNFFNCKWTILINKSYREI